MLEFIQVSPRGGWMKLFMLRVCSSHRPRLKPVKKRAQRSLSLITESVYQAEADLSPAILGCSSGVEDRQVNRRQGECGVMRKMQEQWVHRGGSPTQTGPIREGGGVHIVSEGGQGEGGLRNNKQKSQCQECGIRGGGRGLQWKMG